MKKMNMILLIFIFATIISGCAAVGVEETYTDQAGEYCATS